MKDSYRVKPYAHHKLKWVVRGKENGKYVRKFFPTKTEAETYAQQKNVEARNLGAQALQFPDELRVMALEASRELESFGRTIRDAKNFYLQHLKRTQKAASLSKVIEEVVAAKIATGVKPRTMMTYSGYVNNFSRDFPGREIGTISTEEIESWLIRKFPNPVSRNNNRRVLVNLFNLARKKKYVDRNPVSDIGTAKEPSREVGILRPEQVVALLSNSAPEILPYFAIAAFAGIRPEELRKKPRLATSSAELLWSDIKWKQGIIRVRAEVSKVGKARNVTMEPNLREWLEAHARKQGAICTPNWTRHFRRTRQEAGILDWPHDCLRHSFATYWLEKYKDAPRLALEMGNSVPVILDHYHKVLDEPEDAERYWNILPEKEAKDLVPFKAA